LFIFLFLLLRLYSHHSSFPYTPLLPSDQTSLVSSFPVQDHWGGNSLPRSAAAKLMIGARQRRLCFSSCSSLPAPVKISLLDSHPHNTYVYKLSLFTCLPNNIPLRSVMTSLMALHYMSEVRFSLRSVNPHTPWQSTQKSLGCTPLLPSPKSVHLWGVHRHRTGWRLVGVPFRFTLQTV